MCNARLLDTNVCSAAFARQAQSARTGSTTRTLVAIQAAEAGTADHRGITLLIAVAYDGCEEIADAVREILRDKLKQGEEVQALIESISQEDIARCLLRA